MSDFVIKPMAARLYAAADFQSVCVDEALCGMGATILETQGEWRKVRMEYGYEGFIEAHKLAEPSPQLGREAFTVIAFTADLLTEPEVKAPLLQTMTMGGLVYSDATIAETKDWRSVYLPDGRHGFMRNQFLKARVKPITIPSASNPAEEAPINALRNAILETAFLYKNSQYRWGGKTPLGLDCSGLCFMAYWINGITIYRDAKIREDYPIRPINLQDAKKGDLVFFPGHVALWLGDGEILHSSIAGNGVGVNALFPEKPGFLPKLAESVITAGTVFA